MALAGVLLGLGFLGKMLAGFLALPALALAYLICGQPKLGKRIWQLLVGGAALLLTAGWWVAIVLLTPAADRPYVGGTTDNNILNLTFGYNGLGRLTGNRGGVPGGAGRAPGRALGGAAGDAARGLGGAAGDAARGPGGFGGRGAGGGGGALGGGSGLTRLFGSEWGGQISWLIPAALIAFAVMLWVSRRCGQDRPDPRRRPACGAAGCWWPASCSATCPAPRTRTTRSRSPRRSARWPASAPWVCGGSATPGSRAAPWPLGWRPPARGHGCCSAAVPAGTHGCG